ncbi:MAG: hypothetical protein KDD50_15580, partial [Bdellovibrionales bacterium]|nr:hypothetical protein [Bdellovibrionales bacterium]
MTYRPWPFSLVSFGFLALALSMPVQSAYLFELPLYAIVDQIGHMTDLNLTIFVLLIVQSPLIWKAHRSIKISVPLTAILVLINNFYVGTYGFQFNMVHSSIASLYFLGLCGFIFLPESLFALNHPNKRWWMSPERAKKNLPIKLSTHTL